MTKAPIDRKYRFRDHPKLRYHGVPTWPPEWGGVCGSCGSTPRGEAGILLDVKKVDEDSLYPEHLILTVEHDGREYFGGLWIEEPESLEKFYDLLKENLGKKIEEIGKMEIL